MGSTLWDLNVNELQVLNFTKESDESRVEVDTDLALFSVVAIFLNKQELVKVLLSVFFNTINPFDKLLLLEFFKALAKGVVQLLHILELFTLLDRGGKLTKAFHGLVDSVVEATGPVECTSNWGHV